MPAPLSAPLPTPLLAIDFDRLAQGVLPPGVLIKTQFAAPDVVPGVTGSAWRSDGFSSYAQAPLALDPRSGFTLSLWVALEILHWPLRRHAFCGGPQHRHRCFGATRW